MNMVMILSAKYLYLVVILVSIIFFLLQKRSIQKGLAIFSAASLFSAFVIGLIAGKLYYDPRPFVAYHFKPLIAHAPTNGFPSDHALLCFTLASIIFVFNKKWGIVLGVLSLLVGIARIYVGIHSAIDIAGSFIIATGIVFILQKFIRTQPSPLIS